MCMCVGEVKLKTTKGAVGRPIKMNHPMSPPANITLNTQPIVIIILHNYVALAGVLNSRVHDTSRVDQPLQIQKKKKKDRIFFLISKLIMCVCGCISVVHTYHSGSMMMCIIDYYTHAISQSSRSQVW